MWVSVPLVQRPLLGMAEDPLGEQVVLEVGLESHALGFQRGVASEGLGDCRCRLPTEAWTQSTCRGRLPSPTSRKPSSLSAGGSRRDSAPHPPRALTAHARVGLVALTDPRQPLKAEFMHSRASGRQQSCQKPRGPASSQAPSPCRASSPPGVLNSLWPMSP